MLPIVLLGLFFSVLLLTALFVFSFLSVAFSGPRAARPSAPTQTLRVQIQKTQIRETESPYNSPATTTLKVPGQEQKWSEPAAGGTMSWKLAFSSDARHLWIMFGFLMAVGTGSLVLRGMLVPESFGRIGPYRAAALTEIAALPTTLSAETTCLKCHEDVQEERAESPHKAVHCVHCHGFAKKHVAQALRAEKSADIEITPAQDWDGNFLTSMDLYKVNHRAACVVCHKAVVGQGKDFRSINIEEHLEENEAEDPQAIGVCFECHSGHDPAP